MISDNILHRSNLRGLVKCKQCNHYNGVRAISCKNKKCLLSKAKIPRKLKSNAVDAVKLITNDETRLYSVQVDLNIRNFVCITDCIISSDESGSIISRHTICHVDSCKLGFKNVNSSCKHIKECLSAVQATANPLKILRDAINSMEALSSQNREHLWKLSTESEPVVQQVNSKVFVVRCNVNPTFPAGFLHVYFNNNPDKPNYACACKKIKILMSTNNSIVLENDKCDHILLCMAAILCDDKLKKVFHAFVPGFCLKVSNNSQLSNTSDKCLEYISTQNYEKTSSLVEPEVDNDGTVATTLIDNLNNIELMPIPSTLTSQVMDFDDNTPRNENATSITGDNESKALKLCANSSFQNLESMELIDCQIELMDQFRLTDQVELCNTELGLNYANCESNDGQGDYFDVGSICDMPEFNYLESDAIDFFNLYDQDVLIQESETTITNTADNGNNLGQVKLKKSINSSRTHANITNSSDTEETSFCKNENDLFTNWLDSVIEVINNTMQYSCNGRPEPLHFSIPHIYFDSLRKKFSVGTIKKRLPSRTVLINEGKYKRLTSFSWIFSNVKLIKYIFTTKNSSIDLIRTFIESSPGNFKYIDINEENTAEQEINITNTTNIMNYRKIKPTEYKTFLKIKKCVDSRKVKLSNNGGLFIVEWIPNVLPRSKYGELIIKFEYGHLKNNKPIKFPEI